MRAGRGTVSVCLVCRLGVGGREGGRERIPLLCFVPLPFLFHMFFVHHGLIERVYHGLVWSGSGRLVWLVFSCFVVGLF